MTSGAAKGAGKEVSVPARRAPLDAAILQARKLGARINLCHACPPVLRPHHGRVLKLAQWHAGDAIARRKLASRHRRNRQGVDPGIRPVVSERSQWTEFAV
jgi:hypothetical protein